MTGCPLHWRDSPLASRVSRGDLCGPPMMLKACMDMLDNLGVEPENILFDDFC